MCPEDLTLEDVERAERNYIAKHGELSSTSAKHLNQIKEYLRIYEVGKTTLQRVSDEMYRFSQEEDVKQAELIIKQVADGFWD